MDRLEFTYSYKQQIPNWNRQISFNKLYLPRGGRTILKFDSDLLNAALAEFQEINENFKQIGFAIYDLMGRWIKSEGWAPGFQGRGLGIVYLMVYPNQIQVLAANPDGILVTFPM